MDFVRFWQLPTNNNSPHPPVSPSRRSKHHVINPYTGCQHACSYCYARFMKRVTGQEPRQEPSVPGIPLSDREFTFTVKIPGNKLAVKTAGLPLSLQGRYWPPYSQPLIWVVLQDKRRNYYLQSPPVNFLPNGCWVADNIIPGKGITRIHFVAVGAQDHTEFMHKVRRKEWGAFSDLPADGKIIKSVPISLKIN